MKKNVMFVIVGFILTTTAVFGQDSKIKIKNASKWDIDHIYISPVDKISWGDDLLGDDEVLKPGESVEILADCDTYDVRIIDMDGIECIVEDVNICFDDSTWNIGDLTKCKK